jgi:twitching motility protein PilT
MKLNHSLMTLVQQGYISRDEALKYADNPKELQELI